MKGRTILAAISGLALAAPALAADNCEGTQTPGSTRLAVQVNGVKPAVGEVAVTVYPDDRRRFLAPGGKLARARVRAQAPSTRVCFWLPPGSYAVAAYHDANGDRDFNRGLTGLPAEGFGFSNDPVTKTALPPLESVRFQLPGAGRTLSVRMKYLK